MKILWMGNLVRTDVHNNQPNKPGYTQIRNRLWGVVYAQDLVRDVHTAQCEVGGVWEFRKHTDSYRTRRWNDYCGTIKWKITDHHYCSLILGDAISSSKSHTVAELLPLYDWDSALKEFNQDSYDKLRSSWMMYLLKNVN